jgi:capsid portal protein
VQIVGGKKVFFKEFCDPRIIDRRTGEVADEKLPKELRASEVYHFKIKSCRQTPYGMPRFTGNIISVRGSRQADETNLITLMNNNIPSFAILANGAMLTQGSIERIREFVQSQMAGSSNFSKWLILEGESTHDGLSSPGNAKIEIVPLTKAQHSDMLFQNYDENNAKKLRRNFRVAPILVGASENYDRATAQVSERLTEKYVFNPEREAEDRIINKILLRQGIRFWNFKSNSPNVTNDEDLVHILTGAERSGALTPRISRLLLEDILNRELPGFENMPADFNPDVPFSYTLAKLMHSVGSANQNGTFAPQGQMPKSSDILGLNTETLFTEIFKNPNQYLQSLLELRGHLKLGLEKEAFGEAAGGIDGKQCC